jgi:hypothetical protein
LIGSVSDFYTAPSIISDGKSIGKDMYLVVMNRDDRDAMTERLVSVK